MQEHQTTKKGNTNMKKIYYAIDFYATETLQNGKERETTQTVYFPKHDQNGRLSKWSPMLAAEAAEKELKEQRYYKLIYRRCREVKMSVME